MGKLYDELKKVRQDLENGSKSIEDGANEFYIIYTSSSTKRERKRIRSFIDKNISEPSKVELLRKLDIYDML